MKFKAQMTQAILRGVGTKKPRLILEVLSHLNLNSKIIVGLAHKQTCRSVEWNRIEDPEKQKSIQLEFLLYTGEKIKQHIHRWEH